MLQEKFSLIRRSHFVISITRNLFAEQSKRKVYFINSVLSTVHKDLLIPFVLQGLINLVRENDIRRHIANLIALPMIPKHLVRQQFDLISKQLCRENKSFNQFIMYVRRTYINSRRFSIVAWNHYNHLGTHPRTNNHVEGSHRQLRK